MADLNHRDEMEWLTSGETNAAITSLAIRATAGSDLAVARVDLGLPTWPACAVPRRLFCAVRSRWVPGLAHAVVQVGHPVSSDNLKIVQQHRRAGVSTGAPTPEPNTTGTTLTDSSPASRLPEPAVSFPGGQMLPPAPQAKATHRVHDG